MGKGLRGYLETRDTGVFGTQGYFPKVKAILSWEFTELCRRVCKRAKVPIAVSQGSSCPSSRPGLALRNVLNLERR